MTNSMRVSLAILGLLAMAGMAKGQVPKADDPSAHATLECDPKKNACYTGEFPFNWHDCKPGQYVGVDRCVDLPKPDSAVVEPIIAPRKVIKTYTLPACPDGYEGHYLDLNSWFDENGGGGGGSLNGADIPSSHISVCVSKELVKKLLAKPSAK